MNADTLATRRRSHLFLLALILALAALLRCFSLGALGFWTDEFCTLSCSHGWGLQFDKVPTGGIVPPCPVMTRLTAAQPFSKIIPAMVRDEAHPPLYFLLIRLWENIWGDSESAVRSLNVIFSLLAIALLFPVARESVGATTALWACLLMALAEPQIQFAQEARNYMLVLPLWLLAAGCIQRLKRRPIFLYAATLALAILAMMLTHYFAVGIAGGLFIYSTISLRGRAAWLALSAFVSAAILFLVLWGPQLLSQWPHFTSNYAWISDRGPAHLQHVGMNLCRLPWRLVAELPHNSIAELIGVAFFILLPIGFIRRPELRLWIICLISSIGIILAVDLWRSTAQLALTRYSLFGSPAMCVLIAAAIPRGRWRRLLPAVAVLLMLNSLPAAYVPPWKIDYRTPVQIVAHRLDSTDGLIITGPDSINNGIMYAAFQHYLPTMPITAVLNAPPNPATLARLSKCPPVWIIWIWPTNFQRPPGFQSIEEQQIPYFADLILGHF